MKEYLQAIAGRQFQALPPAVLEAHKYNGSLVQSGCVLGTLKQITDPEYRAQALASLLPLNTVICKQSAAWVWGALTELPLPYCINTKPAVQHFKGISHSTLNYNKYLKFSRSKLLPTDVHFFLGATVTTPARTLRDLLFTDQENIRTLKECITKLQSLAGLEYNSTLAILKQSKNRGKHIAIANLDYLENLQV